MTIFGLNMLSVMRLLAVICIIMPGCSEKPAQRLSTLPGNNSASAELLHVSNQSIDFGEVNSGHKAKVAIVVTNATDKSVEISSISTSCSCLTFNLGKKVITPSETITAQLLLDLSKEPDFVGGLMMEVTAKTPDGAIAFSLHASVDVRQPISK